MIIDVFILTLHVKLVSLLYIYNAYKFYNQSIIFIEGNIIKSFKSSTIKICSLINESFS